MHNPQFNILTTTFRLVSCSNTFQILLLFVQRVKAKKAKKKKDITKKFVRFLNHCLMKSVTNDLRMSIMYFDY